MDASFPKRERAAAHANRRRGGGAAVMPFVARALGVGIILSAAWRGCCCCDPLEEQKAAEGRRYGPGREHRLGTRGAARQQQQQQQQQQHSRRLQEQQPLLQPPETPLDDPRPLALEGRDGGEPDSPEGEPRLVEGPEVVVGAGAVWSKLATAGLPEQRDRCLSPPCAEGKHIHTEWDDFGEEMARVEGAVVVRRPDLVLRENFAPANTLDFAKVLESYFATFEDSLFPRKMLERGHSQIQIVKLGRFLEAVREGDAKAGKYLSSYYATTEVPKPASVGYENVPTVASMADVFVNNVGFVWNSKDFVAPNNCKSEKNGASASVDLPTGAESYEKVFVMANHWGDGYYHFLLESLPRILTMQDVLLEQPDIKIAVHAPEDYAVGRKDYMYAFLELLGMDRDRVIFIKEPIFAELAIVPDAITCGKPNAALLNMLRTALLRGMYPATQGVPPRLPRPTIVLVVREHRRGLQNNAEVRDALALNFPSFDVFEFTGNGTTLEQLQTFATAAVVVAPHGAGLSNTIVSPLHTPVLEIAPFACAVCYINFSVKIQSVYARHGSTSVFNEACEGWFNPEPDAVVSLVRDLLEAKRQVDAADPPEYVSTPT